MVAIWTFYTSFQRSIKPFVEPMSVLTLCFHFWHECIDNHCMQNISYLSNFLPISSHNYTISISSGNGFTCVHTPEKRFLPSLGFIQFFSLRSVNSCLFLEVKQPKKHWRWRQRFLQIKSLTHRYWRKRRPFVSYYQKHFYLYSIYAYITANFKKTDFSFTNQYMKEMGFNFEFINTSYFIT